MFSLLAGRGCGAGLGWRDGIPEPHCGFSRVCHGIDVFIISQCPSQEEYTISQCPLGGRCSLEIELCHLCAEDLSACHRCLF